MALQWVQQYIHLFNGDNARVTIFGESAGGGSVMLHEYDSTCGLSFSRKLRSELTGMLSIAYGGTLGTQLFRNSISSSPYLAFQYGYSMTYQFMPQGV